MTTLTKRNRARLAMRLLEPQQEPDVGDHVLIWAQVMATEESGRVGVSVTWQSQSRVYVTQCIMVDRSDVVLVTAEKTS